MATIIWDNTFPADASSQMSMAHSIRTTKEAVANGLGTSFFWPGSAASQGDSADSAGEMLLGTGRAMNLTDSSNFLSAGGSPNGYIGFKRASTVISTQGSSNLYLQHIGSENTHVIAGSGIEEVVAVFDRRAANSNQQSLATLFRWVVDEGTFTVSEDLFGAWKETVTFGVTYNAAPYVFQSIDSGACSHGVDTVTGIDFISRGSSFGNAAPSAPGSVQIWWRSEGTVDWPE